MLILEVAYNADRRHVVNALFDLLHGGKINEQNGFSFSQHQISWHQIPRCDSNFAFGYGLHEMIRMFATHV